MWSQLALEKLVPVLPELIGGSADLTGSNGTRTKHHVPCRQGSFAGNYIHYGVREHGMAAAMNGIALHGGFIPYGGTFLVFTDYCRPSIRLSALMRQRVIYVMTHDFIGLGEDGPTHQPVEHLAALRAIPNLNVFRPADGVETAECWELALAHDANAVDAGAVAAGGRRTCARRRRTRTSAPRAPTCCSEPEGERDVTLIATGSEVASPSEAAKTLAKRRHPRRRRLDAVVGAVPRAARSLSRARCWATAPRVAVEAGVAQGWDEWLGDKDRFIGMTDFGASAPAPKLYEHFGITAAAVAEAARSLRRASEP